MATTADIRNGLCIEFNDDIFQIIEFQHAQVGRGAAHVRTKIRSMTTGRVLEYTFASGHKINEVRVERRKFQFLYADEMGYNFIPTFYCTYIFHNFSINPSDRISFLKNGFGIIESYDGFESRQQFLVSCLRPSDFQR